MDKIEKLKKFLIDNNYLDTQIFDCKNTAGDYMIREYDEDDITLDYAPGYDYLEVFGLTKEEFESLLQQKNILSIKMDFLNLKEEQ